jgi:hypothetical protein
MARNLIGSTRLLVQHHDVSVLVRCPCTEPINFEAVPLTCDEPLLSRQLFAFMCPGAGRQPPRILPRRPIPPLGNLPRKPCERTVGLGVIVGESEKGGDMRMRRRMEDISS